MKTKHLIFAGFFALFLWPFDAHADCTDPDAVEGDIVYNQTFHVLQFCNGTQWMAAGGGAPSETDPQVGTLTNAKWCTTDGTVIDCTSDAPGGGVADGDKGDVTVSGSGATWTVDNAAITDTQLRNSAALSVIGRGANSSGAPADLAAGTDGNVLRRLGTALAFGAIDLASAGAVSGDLSYASLRA